MKLRKELQARLLDHPEIELKKSRFADKEAFFVGKREIAHFHGNNEIDIRLTKAEIRKRGYAKTGDSRIHLRNPSGDWVEVGFRKEQDLDLVVEIASAAVKENLKQLR